MTGYQSKRAAAQDKLVQPEPVAKPYAYEYGRCNADGTYSVVIEKGDLVQTMPAVYNYVRPQNAHKDWPIKELFDAPPQRPWVNLTDNQIEQIYYDLVKIHRGAPMPWGQIQFGKVLQAAIREANT